MLMKSDILCIGKDTSNDLPPFLLESALGRLLPGKLRQSMMHLNPVALEQGNHLLCV
jgi:hypothetical protein